MKTIWKYPLEMTDLQIVTMPAGAEILTVQVQNGCPCLWALVDSDSGMTERREIEIVDTGNPVAKTKRRYLGTVQTISGSVVWHVFERTK